MEAPAPEAAPRWQTLLVERSEEKSAVPRRFLSSGDSLRLIVEVGEPRMALRPAVVVVNLLAETTSLPVVSLRSERGAGEGGAADTTRVAVAAGPLYLYVAEARGAEGWTVTVQAPAR